MFIKIIKCGLLFVIFGFDHYHVNAFSSGPPTSVCGSMTPGHGGSPQSSPSPFLISTDVSTYSKSSIVEITISSNGSTPFKGYMVQMRQPGDSDEVFGTFSTTGDIRGIDCRSDQTMNVVTHSNPDSKTSVTLTWHADENDIGINLIPVVTFVQNTPTYWVKETGPLISWEPPCSIVCKNGGTGVCDNGDEYCECPDGFTGTTCQKIVVYCPCEEEVQR